MRIAHHLWTLSRRHLTTRCVVSQRPRSGTWTLRLTCNGRKVLDSRFETLGEAIAQSSITFGAFLTRGWIVDTDLAGPPRRPRAAVRGVAESATVH
jgi:hypothetical protein